LKIQTEHLPECEVKLSIELDEATVDEAMRKAARKVALSYNVPGFRKGKAPFAAVVRAYGKDALYEQVVDDLGEKVYKDALEQTGLDPIGPGAMTDVSFEPLVMEFRVPMPPVVDLGDYRSVRVERPAAEVTEEELQSHLKTMQESVAEWVPVEGQGAEYGDLLTVRIKGEIDDEIILDEEAFELELDQENTAFPPDFDTQFLGKQSGDALEFDLTYPEDWQSERAGNTAHFSAEMVGIKRYELPPLDEEFPALVGDYENLDALINSVREGIAEEKRTSGRSAYLNQVLDAIIDQAPSLLYPHALIDQWVDRLYGEQENDLARAGLPMSEFLRLTDQTEETFRNRLHGPAEQRLRGELVLSKLAELEQLTASDQEIDEQAADLLSVTPESGRDTFETFLRSSDGRQALAADIVRGKSLERLLLIGEGLAPELPAADDSSETAAPPEEPAAEPVAIVDEPSAEPVVVTE